LISYFASLVWSRSCRKVELPSTPAMCAKGNSTQYITTIYYLHLSPVGCCPYYSLVLLTRLLFDAAPASCSGAPCWIILFVPPAYENGSRLPAYSNSRVPEAIATCIFSSSSFSPFTPKAGVFRRSAGGRAPNLEQATAGSNRHHPRRLLHVSAGQSAPRREKEPSFSPFSSSSTSVLESPGIPGSEPSGLLRQVPYPLAQRPRTSWQAPLSTLSSLGPQLKEQV
jgi:hypothetical protein